MKSQPSRKVNDSVQPMSAESLSGETREEREKSFSRRALLQWSLPAAAMAIGALSPSVAKAEYVDIPHQDHEDYYQDHDDIHIDDPSYHYEIPYQDQYTDNHWDEHSDHDDGEYLDSHSDAYEDTHGDVPHEDYLGYYDHSDVHDDHTDLSWPGGSHIDEPHTDHDDYQDHYDLP